jgi:hypothetical protein
MTERSAPPAHLTLGRVTGTGSCANGEPEENCES